MTHLSLDEKNIIYEILIDHGLPINSEMKDDYVFIKNELVRLIKPKDNQVSENEKRDPIKELQDVKDDGENLIYTD